MGGAHTSGDTMMELAVSAEYTGVVTDTLVKIWTHIYHKNIKRKKENMFMEKAGKKKMCLEEVEKLKTYSTEADLIKIAQIIDDRVIFRNYSDEQILCLVNELVRLDLLSVKYETREEVLHLICDIISFYDIPSDIDWGKIINIKNEVEDDLKEYISEFIEPLKKYSF